MKYVKSYSNFNESYLEGSRQPIYHHTKSLVDIINDDVLKMSTPAYPSNRKSISLTRYNDYGDGSYSYTIELDSDLLLRDGYRSYPVDEIGMAGDKSNDIIPNKKLNYSKSNWKNQLSGVRGTRYKNSNGPWITLEVEFEERIYKDIINLGKYIRKIYIRGYLENVNLDIIKEYVEKYPHIEVFKVTGVNIADNNLRKLDLTKSNDVISNQY